MVFIPRLYLLQDATAILQLDIYGSGNNLAVDRQNAGNEQGSFHKHVKS